MNDLSHRPSLSADVDAAAAEHLVEDLVAGLTGFSLQSIKKLHGLGFRVGGHVGATA